MTYWPSNWLWRLATANAIGVTAVYVATGREPGAWMVAAVAVAFGALGFVDAIAQNRKAGGRP